MNIVFIIQKGEIYTFIGNSSAELEPFYIYGEAAYEFDTDDFAEDFCQKMCNNLNEQGFENLCVNIAYIKEKSAEAQELLKFVIPCRKIQLVEFVCIDNPIDSAKKMFGITENRIAEYEEKLTVFQNQNNLLKKELETSKKECEASKKECSKLKIEKEKLNKLYSEQNAALNNKLNIAIEASELFLLSYRIPCFFTQPENSKNCKYCDIKWSINDGELFKIEDISNDALSYVRNYSVNYVRAICESLSNASKSIYNASNPNNLKKIGTCHYVSNNTSSISTYIKFNCMLELAPNFGKEHVVDTELVLDTDLLLNITSYPKRESFKFFIIKTNNINAKEIFAVMTHPYDRKELVLEWLNKNYQSTEDGTFLVSKNYRTSVN